MNKTTVLAVEVKKEDRLIFFDFEKKNELNNRLYQTRKKMKIKK